METLTFLVSNILPSLVMLANGDHSTFFIQQLIPFMHNKVTLSFEYNEGYKIQVKWWERERKVYFLSRVFQQIPIQGLKDASQLIKCVLNNISELGFNKNGSRVVQVIFLSIYQDFHI